VSKSGTVFTSVEANMARIKGVEPEEAGFVTRIIYWFVRRKVGALAGRASVVEPVKITAHHPSLLRAFGQMEQGQAGARTVPESLKALASLRVAMLVGCTF
jgi:4-carboxymuconolactone decarboxylase